MRGLGQRRQYFHLILPMAFDEVGGFLLEAKEYEDPQT